MEFQWLLQGTIRAFPKAPKPLRSGLIRRWPAEGCVARIVVRNGLREAIESAGPNRGPGRGPARGVGCRRRARARVGLRSCAGGLGPGETPEAARRARLQRTIDLVCEDAA